MAVKRRRGNGSVAPYIFISPFIISFILFFLAPSIYSLILSLFKYRGYGAATFVGFNNYTTLLTYSRFWSSVRNTLFYYLVHLVPSFVIPFLIAVAINSKISRFKRVYKASIFVPHMVSVAASALVWRILLSTRNGVVNAVLGTQIPFLESGAIMKWSVIILYLWRGIGWFLVVFLSGLTTVGDEITDAANIDGANAFQEMVFVTIPIMKPIFMFAFVMDTITSLKMFTEPTLLLNAGASSAPVEGETIMSILTRNISGGNFGMASATGWILFIMILSAALLQLKVFSKEE